MKYNTSKTYETSREAETALRSLRPLQAGDKITVNGISREIETVMYSDVFVEYKNDCNACVIFFMCEFKAKGDHYGYYKSYWDGGIVELKEG